MKKLIQFLVVALILVSCGDGRLSPQGGTIVGVNAGNGLTGGGLTGIVTLNTVCGYGLTCLPDSVTIDNSVVVDGSGTLNYVPLWTPDGNTLGNSIMSQSGSTVTTTGNHTVTGSLRTNTELVLAAAGTNYIYTSLAGSSGNQSLAITAAGNGQILLQTNAGGLNNAGTSGVIIGPGGASSTAMHTFDGAGNADHVGTARVHSGLSGGTISDSFQVGNLVSSTTSADTGFSVGMNRTDGNVTWDVKNGGTGSLYGRVGAGTSNGFTNTWLQVTGSTGATYLYKNVQIGTNPSSTHFMYGDLQSVEGVGTTFNNDANIRLRDDTSFAQGVGGRLDLFGYYNGAGNIAGVAIKAMKTNGTENHYGFDMAFATMADGGGMSERLRIDSVGNTFAVTDNTYLAWDANNARVGITKKSGSTSKHTYGSASDWCVAQSSGTDIAATNTFTDRFCIKSDGAISLGSSDGDKMRYATFIPTTVGWYRIVDAGFHASGTVKINGFYDNRQTDVEIQYTVNGFGATGSIQQVRYSNYNTGFVQYARISSNSGTGAIHLDIYINSATTPGSVYLFGYGPAMPAFVNPIVVGAVADTADVQVLTLADGFNTTDQISLGRATKAGQITFARGNDGAATGFVGWLSPLNDTTFQMVNTSGAGEIRLNPASTGGFTTLWSTTSGGANAERMRVDDTGNVGIASTTPAGRLSVKTTDSITLGSGAWDTSWSIFGPNVDSASGAALGLAYNTTSDYANIVSLAPGVAWKPLYFGTNGMLFYTANAAYAGEFRSSGPFWIQSAGPAGFTANALNFQITDTTAQQTGSGPGINFIGKYNDAGDITTAAALKVKKLSGSSGDFNFGLGIGTRMNPSSDVTERMFLSANNGVDIYYPGGVINSGGYLLKLGGTATGVDTERYMIGFTHGSVSDGAIRAGIGAIVKTGGAGMLVFETGTGGAQTERMRIDADGQVGISGVDAATDALAHLDVRGQIIATRQAGSYAAPLNTGVNSSTIEANLVANSLITIGDEGTGVADPAITLYRTTSGLRTGTGLRTVFGGDLVFRIQRGTYNTAYGAETYTDQMTVDSNGYVTFPGTGVQVNGCTYFENAGHRCNNSFNDSDGPLYLQYHYPASGVIVGDNVTDAFLRTYGYFHSSRDNAPGLIVSEEQAATVAGNGGSIQFEGSWTGTTQTPAALIKASKYNNLDGHFRFDLLLQSRYHGGGLLDTFRITGEGRSMAYAPGLGGQTTAALTDAGDRGGMLWVGNAGTAAGAGGALVFGNGQSEAVGAVGGAAIKYLLTDGGNNTSGDLAIGMRRQSVDSSFTEYFRLEHSNGNANFYHPLVNTADVTDYHGAPSGDFGLNIAGYVDTHGDAAIWHNAYSTYQSSGGGSDGQQPKYRSSHGSFGARGIDFSYTGGDAIGGIAFFAHSGATLPDVGFTPQLRMMVGNDGKVGIGTSSPNTELHVIGASQATPNMTDAGNSFGEVMISDTGSSVNNGGALSFTYLNSNTTQVRQAAFKMLAMNGTANGVGDLALSMRVNTSDTSLTEAFRVRHNGNVGVGSWTANSQFPTAKFQVLPQATDPGTMDFANWAGGGNQVPAAIVHQTTNTTAGVANSSLPVLILGRQGAGGVSYANYAEFKLSRVHPMWGTSGAEARTKLDIALTADSNDVTGFDIASFVASSNNGENSRRWYRSNQFNANAQVYASSGLFEGRAGSHDAEASTRDSNYMSGIADTFQAGRIRRNYFKYSDAATAAGDNTGAADGYNDGWSEYEYPDAITRANVTQFSPRGVSETTARVTCVDDTCSGDFRNTVTSLSTGWTDVRNKVFTYSIWAKSTTGSPNINITIGRYGDADVESANCTLNSSTWTRCSVTQQFNNTSLADNSEIRAYLTGFGSSFAVDLWGGQLEDNTQPSAYQSNNDTLSPAPHNDDADGSQAVWANVLAIGDTMQNPATYFTNSLSSIGNGISDVLDVNGDVSKFGGTRDGLLYFNGNEVNAEYAVNGLATLYFNYRGYNGGTSQFRDIIFSDGKNATGCTFTGSTKVLNCVGGLQVNGVNVGVSTSVSGTTGTIAKFTSTSTVGDSIMTETSSLITIAGGLQASTKIRATVTDNTDAIVLGTTSKQWSFYPVSGSLDLWEYATTLEGGGGASRFTIAAGGNATFKSNLTVLGDFAVQGGSTFGDAGGDRVESKGNFGVSGTDATVNSCGSSPSISGEAQNFQITVGSGTTTCVINFNRTYNSAPFCVFSAANNQASLDVASSGANGDSPYITATTTTVTLTFDANTESSPAYNVWCPDRY